MSNSRTIVVHNFPWLNRRNLFFMGMTIALHFIFLQTPSLQKQAPDLRLFDPSPLRVTLKARTNKATPPDLSPDAQVAQAKPRPHPARPVKKRLDQDSVAPPEPTLTKPETPVETQVASIPQSQTQVQEEASKEVAPVVTNNTNQESETIGSTASNAYTALIPESVEMHMEVTHTKLNGSTTTGTGHFVWQVKNNVYQIQFNVGVQFLFAHLNLFSIRSEGEIGERGLMPRMATDSRRNRAETAIHFDYKANEITLSASNKTMPLLSGAQDAASLLMQLTAIGNANPAKLKEGNEFRIQVAEGRDASEFLFQVVGEESIKSPLSETGELKAIHIARPPRAGSYNSRLDIWLAPEKRWYPVQIRHTESNGNITHQIVTGFKSLPGQAGNDQH